MKTYGAGVVASGIISLSLKTRFTIGHATAWLHFRVVRAARLLLPLLLLALPAVAQAQFNYTTNNNTITITGYTGPDGAVTIPSTINGLAVVSIGDYAFYYSASLTNVTIPSSVTSIGVHAFSSCTSLTSVTMGNSVNSIGHGAFSYCTSLAEITVDALNSVYCSVDGVLFNKSQTTIIQYPAGKAGSYTIPSSVTNIGEGAFNWCTSLISVTIGNSVTSIGEWAFFSCKSLTSITIPNSVTNIGGDAFFQCTGLVNVTIGNGVTSIGFGAFSAGPSLVAITVDTLNPCYSSLDGVLFNKSQTTLIQCPVTKAGNVTIPYSVTNIGTEAFSFCTRLAAFMVDAQNPVYSSVDGILFNRNQTTLIKYPAVKSGSYVIPSSVTSIVNYAFSYCTNLTGVMIGNSITNIGDAAFYRCTSLISVSIPNSVTSIEDNAFYGCSSLTSVTIPDSVASIRQQAFHSCASLTSITIPKNVKSIENFTFYSCINLTSITIPNSVTNIGNNTFQHCTSLTSVTIPNSVTSIGQKAFFGCMSLTGVYFKGNAPSVGTNVLYLDNAATVYYLAGTTGWSTTFGGRPTMLWKPQVQAGGPSFGMRTNRFGFNINWASGRKCVVEACTNLAHPTWSPLQTNTLTGDSLYFSDPQWTNYRGRFYRLRSP